MSFNNKGWPRPAGNNQMNPIFQVGQQFGNLQGMIPNVNLNALVNTAAFSNMLAQQQPRPALLPQVPQNQRTASPQNKKKSFVGSITKFLEGYGFIDDEVFFQTAVVSGGHPHVGSRCMVEAIYNSSMPFHWNATSVQIIPDNNPPQMHNAAPPRARIPPVGGNRWESSTNGDSGRHDRNNYAAHPHGRDTRDLGHSRRSPVHSRRDVPSHRPIRRSPPPRRASPSPIRRPEKRERTPRVSPPPRRDIRDTSRSREESGPPRRRARVVPRYTCKAIRPLISKTVNCADLRGRYSRLYVPSDFITCEMSWLDSFSLEAPFQLGLNQISFHPVHKDVDIPIGTYPPEDLVTPVDEDHRFVVRTLLLSHAGLADIRKKVFGLLPDGSIDENTETMLFNKAIQFLTGIRGRNEVMAIGGAHSPSKDGENPLDLPTMINTAVRTTRELTGVDLSACPTWYKIAHLEYYRAERDRVDNVILLMPDTSSMNNLMPTPEQYETIVTSLKAQLDEKIVAIEAEEFVSSLEKKRKEAKDSNPAIDNNSTTNDENPNNSDQIVSSDSIVVDATPTHTAEPTSTTNTTTTVPPIPAAAVEAVMNESSDAMDTEEPSNGKCHWSVTLSTLRVADLREQLSIREMDTRGVKNVLIQRLQKALDAEKDAEENGTVAPAEEQPAEQPEVPTEAAPEDPMDTSAVEVKKESEVPEDPQANADADMEAEITLDQLVEKQDDDEFTAEELEEIRREREKFDVIQNEKKQALIRHYVFPEQPTVLVYPNKAAKAGRFDCKVSSLQSLLEYRIEDNKEASFEVFMFAEAVREMFDRTYGFNIYKTIQSIEEPEVENQKRKEALLAAATAAANVAAAAAASAETENGEEAKPETKTDAVTESEKEKERERSERDMLASFKQMVGNFELFASFAYYDSSICGYINDRDLEDILLSLGLRISRGDVLRLMKKVNSRERFEYRIYTDRWIDKDNETKYSPVFREDAPSVDDILNVHPKDTLENGDETKTSGITPDVTENGIVIFKGAALNIKQSLERHQELKDECTKLVTQLQENDFILKSYKEQVDILDKKRKRLEQDVTYYKKKAYDAEKCLKTNEDDVVAYKSALQDCKRLGDRICGIVERVMPAKEKTKEPSAKPDTTPQKKTVESTEDSKEAEGKSTEETAVVAQGTQDETSQAATKEAKSAEEKETQVKDEPMTETHETAA